LKPRNVDGIDWGIVELDSGGGILDENHSKQEWFVESGRGIHDL
jgi:hypothetical protein